MSAPERSRLVPLTPRVEPSTVGLHVPAGELETPPGASRTSGGCRTRVNGLRCGHRADRHLEVGYSGWRVRCTCGCTVYRDPWPRALLTVFVAAVVVIGGSASLWTILLLLYQWWFGGGF